MRIELQDTMFFNGYAELSGYSMEVLDFTISHTAEFLEKYNVSRDETIVQGSVQLYWDEEYCERYDHIAIVTCRSRRDSSEATDPVMLNNFLLVGGDFYLYPSFDTLGHIAGFNEELNGAEGFVLLPDCEVTVQIPYLIDTKSDQAISLRHVEKSYLKLLISLYPEEVYLGLPGQKTNE